MAIPREAQAERAALIRYLRRNIIAEPIGEADEHFNFCLDRIVTEIVAGKHVKAVRNGKV